MPIGVVAVLLSWLDVNDEGELDYDNTTGRSTGHRRAGRL
jgi:hypothetical protein